MLMLRAPSKWAKPAHARAVLAYALVIVLLGAILLYHSGSAPSGLGANEAAARGASRTLRVIYDYPVNAPHKIVEWSVQKLGFHGARALRLSSAIWAVIFTLAFWRLVRSWFGRTVGLLSTVLFLGTPVLLVAGRQASAEIMWLFPILVMAAYDCLVRTHTHHNVAWIGLILAAGLAIYTPGMIWWLLAAAILVRQQLTAAVSEVPRWLIAGGLLLFAVVLLPAGTSIFTDWHIIRDFGLVPAHWAPPLTLVKDIAWMLSSLVFRTPFHSSLFIGRLPLLDIIQIGLVIFGAYALWSTARNKTLVLAAGVLLAVLAAGANDQPNILILALPALGVMAAAGLRYLFIEWRGVFPSNPIPKTLALTLMAALITAQLAYGVTYSVIAWPHTDATKSAYVLK